MRCEELADDLAAAADGSVLLGRNERRHVERCLRCQAELVQYRKVLRAMRAMRTEVLEPAPGLLADILANLEAAGERRAIRSMIQGHRAAYLGGPGRGHRGRRRRRHRLRQPGPQAPHRRLPRPARYPPPSRGRARRGQGGADMGGIPTSIDEITPAWLAEATGLDVEAADIEQIGVGIGVSSALYRGAPHRLRAARRRWS